MTIWYPLSEMLGTKSVSDFFRVSNALKSEFLNTVLVLKNFQISEDSGLWIFGLGMLNL